ncbi:NAD(P)H-dependent oxidoreductase [Winogradskya consettensis]|uniref:FMN dependent NADH:quinone oxidoreductase n=1 Tax=Winogradskya consettensis TaxID=113560 RepID=A0A919VRD4_9ACTN|nr:NAD(P)H-dependent oxidoreductase [Actinoplanes consettensis]GIM73586.1 FMN-dependent NADH-azoreductase [Actinoplanes consettensis]
MTLFRLDASIRVEGSASREIADIVEQEWLAAHPGDTIERRHIGTEPIPATYWAAAVNAPYTPEADRTQEQVAAAALAETLVDELLAADAILFAVPLYNFGPSQHIKAYIDLVATSPRVASGPFLAGKKVVLATVRGGAYGEGTPRHGWDHSTPFLKRIIADSWGADLTVVEREFTLVGVNPALDDFKDLGAQMHAGAVESARQAGKVLGAL